MPARSVVSAAFRRSGPLRQTRVYLPSYDAFVGCQQEHDEAADGIESADQGNACVGEFDPGIQRSADRLALKVLPVESPVPPWPVGVLTLKQRSLNPLVSFFIDCGRKVATAFDRNNSA
jgi:hypothetical protein